MQPSDFCREIEGYLCRKNDGHLIRVTGPSFDLVAGWASRGVPLKIAFQGIDRYFERYYRKGPRRRPVKIDFCEADVLDVFDEWRRATGVVSHQSPATSHESSVESSAPSERPRQSLREHLKRVLMRLSSARVDGTLGESADGVIDRISRELDGIAAGRSIRGEARLQLAERLAALDRELMELARAAIDQTTLQQLEREAGEELAGFRATMAPDAFARAKDRAVERLLRERAKLPSVALP